MSKKVTDEQRERIDELLEVEVNGMRAGVFGREWCEGCGKEGSFSGFILAMAVHSSAGRYLCGACRHGELGGGPRTDELDELILERGFRYCCECGRPVILEERTVEMARRRPLTCPACRGLDRQWSARRRYLEHKAESEGGLEQAAGRVHWARAGLERILEEKNAEE